MKAHDNSQNMFDLLIVSGVKKRGNLKQFMTGDHSATVRRERLMTGTAFHRWLTREGSSAAKLAATQPVAATIATRRQNRGEGLSTLKKPDGSLQPHMLYIATLSVVFLCEFLIMLVLPDVSDLSIVGKAFLDASLLSILAVPFLYGLFFKPLQANIDIRLQKEIEHEKMQEMDRIKSDFVSIAGHELRTPLTVIRGYAELLQMEKMFDGSRRKEFIAIINEKTDVMERMIDDFMDVNRIQSGRPLKIQKERHDIVCAMTSTLNDFRKKYPERAFNVSLPAGRVSFHFDLVRISQVLDNLLSNAVKFSTQDSPVDIEGTLQNERFQVQIRDRGIGMSEEELIQVFEKFYRADTSDTSASGLGLGMAIVKEIIEAHGGDIRLESKGGVGTTVTFSLSVTQQ